MSTKMLLVLLAAIVQASVCFAELTPLEEEVLKKYGVAKEDVEKFATPDIYQDSIPTPRSSAPAFSSEPFRIFGQGIFENADLTFVPSVHDLPPDGYTLGPGDNIIVNVWGRVDLELNLTIDREGRIFIPKVGEIVATGLTLADLEKRLDERLAVVYSDYSLSVSYGKLRQISVYVFGEVRKPGGYAMSSLANVLHALYTAGGITANGSLRDVQLIRNTQVDTHYDLYDLLLKGDGSKNLKLLSGDVVYVPVVGPLARITGQVKRPAIYELTGSERVSDLIELAGGTTPEAFLQSISLDRIGPQDSRILLDLNLADTANIESNNVMLNDGDQLAVFSIYDFHENRVWLTGHVKHPGSFGLSDTLRVSHLLAGGEQLRENAYTVRADLFRTNTDKTKTLVPVNLDQILAGENDMQLQPLDSLVVYSYDHVTREKYVSIGGEVKNSGVYPLYNGMKLSDLVFLAGNTTKKAYMLRGELARLKPTGGTEIIFFDLENAIVNRLPEADFALEEDDHVFIRTIPEWKPVQTVTIDGEVRFPGQYAIKQKDERLSDLVARAGGLTNEAFPEGATYSRKTIESDISRRNIGQIITNTKETRLDSLGNAVKDMQVEFDPAQLNRIVIDLKRILKKPGGTEDLVLANQDYLYVPRRPSGVQVIGAVAANGTINFVKGKRPKFYIEQAGGITPDGDFSQVRLVRPNGKVYYGQKAKVHQIEPGDAIVVPSRIKSKTDWGKILTTTATVIGSVATTVFVIDRLD